MSAPCDSFSVSASLEFWRLYARSTVWYDNNATVSVPLRAILLCEQTVAPSYSRAIVGIQPRDISAEFRDCIHAIRGSSCQCAAHMGALLGFVEAGGVNVVEFGHEVSGSKCILWLRFQE